MYISDEDWNWIIEELDKLKYFLESSYLTDKYERIKFENLISKITSIRPYEMDEIEDILKMDGVSREELTIFKNVYIDLIEHKYLKFIHQLSSSKIYSILSKVKRKITENPDYRDNYREHVKNYYKLKNKKKKEEN